MGEGTSGHVLFVTGMHRGGTSALCAALAACGARFRGELLPPMEGVNDEGFWESAEVVDINEDLLAAHGASWFSLPPGLAPSRFAAERDEALARRAAACLQSGVAEGGLLALKDPRFCLTLPFWLRLGEELGLVCSVCAVWRDPLEVAMSLDRRDALPPGYGLRLQGSYLRALRDSLPEPAVLVSYAELLRNPAGALAGLSAALPLDLDAPALREVVRPDLRHQRNEQGAMALTNQQGGLDLENYMAEVERRYPIEETLRQCVDRIVTRGRELTRIGEAHTHALETIGEKDRDIAGLAREHTHALETITERDCQIEQLDQRLGQAESQLQQLRAAPVLGLVVRAYMKYAKR